KILDRHARLIKRGVRHNKLPGLFNSESKEDYCKNLLTDNVHNPQQLWKILKDILPTNDTVSPITLNINCKEISDPIEVGDLFNEYFSFIADNFDISLLNNPINTHLPIATNHIKFTIPLITIDDILNLAAELDQNKSTGLVDAVNDDYNNSVQNSNSSDDAQLHVETVDNVEQADIENGRITDRRIAAAEQLLILGRSCQTEGRSEEAIKRYEQAIVIADEIGHNDIKAKAYQQLGNVFTGTSKYKKAIEYYEKARQISPRLKGDEIEVIAYQWLGYNHLQAGQYQDSIEYYNEVVRLALQLGCKTREFNASIGLGSALSHIGDFESSEEYFLKAITVAKQLNHKCLEKEAHTNLGHVQYKSCQFNAAVQSYLKAEEISHDLGDRNEEASACLMLGHIFRQLKKHEKAIKSYKKALSINTEIKGKEMQGVCFEKALEGIINEWCGYCCLYIAGQRQEAITSYKNAKEIAKQVGEKYQEYRTNQAIANILCNIGNYEKSKEYYQEALTIAVELGDRHCEGTSCLNLATVCGKDCDYEMAIEWYEKALYIVRTHVNDDILKKKALTGLGIAWFKLGDTKKAIEEIQEAQKLTKDSDTGNYF
ncbi:tetratricopeptide repeat, partial [Paramuricea clavata]